MRQCCCDQQPYQKKKKALVAFIRFETLVEVFIIPTVVTKQPSLPIKNNRNIPEGLLLADPDFRRPEPIELNLGADVYPRLMAGELHRLRPNKSLAQGSRLGYVVTSFLHKETSSDRDIDPI